MGSAGNLSDWRSRGRRGSNRPGCERDPLIHARFTSNYHECRVLADHPSEADGNELGGRNAMELQR